MTIPTKLNSYIIKVEDDNNDNENAKFYSKKLYI